MRLKVSGRVGEETKPGQLSGLVWEGECVPHVNAWAGWPTGSPGLWMGAELCFCSLCCYCLFS